VQEVIVVLQPVGQDVVGDHAPAPFPHLQWPSCAGGPQSAEPAPRLAFTHPGSLKSHAEQARPGPSRPCKAPQGEEVWLFRHQAPCGCPQAAHILQTAPPEPICTFRFNPPAPAGTVPCSGELPFRSGKRQPRLATAPGWPSADATAHRTAVTARTGTR